LTVSAADVADTARRSGRDESVVALAAGEVLTERQSLTALLLPSANNVAIMLARRVAGSVPAFLARMNTAAQALGMTATHYTDPSGFRASTVSTARDQLVLANAAMRIPALAATVALRSAQLPVAGVVHNTDQLLGQDGFVGIKTGSTDAAGGCFMFRARQMVGGHPTVVTGVVLDQPGRNLVMTGQYAARQLVDRLAHSRSTPGAGRN
jgi:D-alanyl-D-alanine carboxypeptidase (penicillin-binding protein 5/6)